MIKDYQNIKKKKKRFKAKKGGKGLRLQHTVTMITLKVKVKMKKLQTFVLWLESVEESKESKEITLEYILTLRKEYLAQGL